ncbi:MAG: class I SAM-dependent methyltransferase, partial [Acholeplasmatales bacterium]|nr:class I SAM-dependent methyltransferase [Acholeplasmatales bacterium]
MERNYNVYLSGMEKGKADKLFFLNHLCLDDYDVIIDFGCGQGDIIKVCAEMSKATCYGIDRDSFMRHVAGESCKHTRVIFEESLNNLVINNKRILLIFSSVLHEVEDYWKNLKEFIVKHTGLIT